MNKQVIFGTTEYHEIMRQIASNSLQRMAGYIAPKMAVSGIQITPVHENYLEWVDPMMQALANDESLVNCNPRAPYLLLAWLLVGSDNPYQIQHKSANRYKIASLCLIISYIDEQF